MTVNIQAPQRAELRALEAERARALAEQDELIARNGDDPSTWDEGQATRAENVMRSLDRIDDKILTLRAESERYEQRISNVIANPANLERSNPTAEEWQERLAPTVRRGGGGSDRDRAERLIDRGHRAGVLPDYAAERASALLGQGDLAERADAARWALAAGDPAYRTAFAKIVQEPERGHMLWTPAEQAAYSEAHTVARSLGLATGSGSVMVPASLDPAIMLTNNGTNNPIRGVARVVQTVASSWNGVTSAGATAEWKAESVESADGSPTLAQATVPVFLGDVDVPHSYEVAMDAQDFLSEIQRVMLDAAERLQATAYTTGNGTTAPQGFITGATNTVNTGGAFAAANVYSLQNALAPRFQAGASFLGSIAVINTIAQFETTAGALKFPEVKDGRLCNRSLYEVSDMTADMSTASSKFLAYGNFKEAFVIADRVGATFELLPGYGANRRPTAERHAFLTFRTGAKVVVPAALQLLNKS